MNRIDFISLFHFRSNIAQWHAFDSKLIYLGIQEVSFFFFLFKKQEHKVSYRCSLPSPLQKRSKDYKGLHRTSASFALLSFLWLWQEESWEISCQSYKFLQFLQIQFLPFCWPPCFWRKRDVPLANRFKNFYRGATFHFLSPPPLFFLLKISLLEMHPKILQEDKKSWRKIKNLAGK